MKALVTGASGFVGSAVLRHLVDAGHEVRVLLRPTSDRRNIEGVACEPVLGDGLGVGGAVAWEGSEAAGEDVRQAREGGVGGGEGGEKLI